jgi:hypothetical protein
MWNRRWLAFVLGLAVLAVFASAVLLVGRATDVPRNDLPMIIATMVLGALIAPVLGEVAKFSARRRAVPRPSETQSQAPPARVGIPDGDLVSAAPTVVVAGLEQALPDTVTFEFNREKWFHWMMIVLTLMCVSGCVNGLFDPEVRGDDGTGEPANIWIWLLFTNAAVVTGCLLIWIAIVSLRGRPYILRLDAAGVVVKNRRREVALPWDRVRRLRFEQNWLIADLVEPADLVTRVHAINGFAKHTATNDHVRRVLHASEVAVAAAYDLNSYKGNKDRFLMTLERFWGLGPAASSPSSLEKSNESPPLQTEQAPNRPDD